MALTKISSGLLADDAISTASLADGIIQAAHLHASHGITTANIAEGSNQYHTTARARAAVSVGGSLAYNSSTGVVTFTQRTDGTIRGLISASGSLSYNNSTGVISYTQRTDGTIRGLVSVTDSGGDGSLAYNNSTGVITYTGPSATEVRAHLSAGTGVTYSSGAISIGQSVATTATPTFGNITTSGYIAGPASFTIDPAAVGDNTGTVVIAGNLQVDGTTTTINSTTVAIDDLNFSIATDAADSAAANGAGITIGGASATLLYTHATTSWDMNKPLNVTGNIGVSGTVDGVDIAARDAILTSTTTTAGAALPKAGGTMTGDLILGDDIKVEIGSLSGGDLQLYHSGGNSYIKNDTSQLYVLADYFNVKNNANSKFAISTIPNDEVILYFNGNEKLATTNTGVNITGNITTSTTLTSAGAINVTNGNSTFITGSSWGTALELRNVNDDVSPAILRLQKTPSSGGSAVADNDYIGGIVVRGLNDAGENHNYIEMWGLATDVSNGSESSRWGVGTWASGTEHPYTLMANAGKVGIGVSGPTALLDIRGSGTGNQKIHFISTSLQNGGDMDFIFGKDNGTALSGALSYYYNTTQGARYIQLRNYGRPLGISVNDSGRVGIGNAVSQNFHDKAANLVVGSGAAGGITYWGGTNESWFAFARDDAVNTDAYDGGMSYNGDRHLKFHTNAGAVRMRIDGSGDGQFYGDWGLEDNKKLTLGGGVDLQIWHDGSDSKIVDAGTGNLLIQGSDIYMGNTSSNHAFVIRSDGNVGIGQTGPTTAGYGFATKLVVGDGDDNDGITIQSGSGHQGNLAFNHTDGSTAYGRISYQHGTNYMQFYVNNALRMQINKNGLNGQVLANGNGTWGNSGEWYSVYDAVSEPVGTRFFYYVDLQGLDGYTSWGYVWKDRNGRWRQQAERQAGTNFRVHSDNRYMQVTQGSGANQSSSSGAFRLVRLMGHNTQG